MFRWFMGMYYRSLIMAVNVLIQLKEGLIYKVRIEHGRKYVE